MADRVAGVARRTRGRPPLRGVDAADRNIRNGWLPILFAVALAIQLTLIVVRLARDADLSGTAATAGSSVFLAAGLCLLWVARRRSKRYLATTAAPTSRRISDDR